MSKPTRTYSSPEVTVEWRPEMCVHCEACFQGLPGVFDPSKRPWVNINGATAEAIRQQVAQCPSKALEIGQ